MADHLYNVVVLHPFFIIMYDAFMQTYRGIAPIQWYVNGSSKLFYFLLRVQGQKGPD